jgi:hypothetical protein
MPGAALQKLVADSRDVPTTVLERARAAVRRWQGLAGLISLNSWRRHD